MDHGGNAAVAVEATMTHDVIPIAEPVAGECDVRAVDSVQPAEETPDGTVGCPESCSAPPSPPERVRDHPHGDETNRIPAVSSADKTNPIPPALPRLEGLLEDLTRRAAALSAAGWPVPIPR
jgi:hypothetical protein